MQSRNEPHSYLGEVLIDTRKNTCKEIFKADPCGWRLWEEIWTIGELKDKEIGIVSQAIMHNLGFILNAVF